MWIGALSPLARLLKRLLTSTSRLMSSLNCCDFFFLASFSPFFSASFFVGLGSCAAFSTVRTLTSGFLTGSYFSYYLLCSSWTFFYIESGIPAMAVCWAAFFYSSSVLLGFDVLSIGVVTAASRFMNSELFDTSKSSPTCSDLFYAIKSEVTDWAGFSFNWAKGTVSALGSGVSILLAFWIFYWS